MRSELRVHTQQHNHVRELQQALTAGAGDFRCEVFLGYALGKELDELGRYDEAYATFAAAAQRRRGRLSYDVRTDEHKLRRIAECYPPEPSPVGTMWTRVATFLSWACPDRAQH